MMRKGEDEAIVEGGGREGNGEARGRGKNGEIRL